MTKIYIENCFCLTFKRVEQSLSRIRKIGDNTDFQRADIRYEEDEINGNYFINVTVARHKPEKIALDPLDTTFGEKNYIICEGCGKRYLKLYLLPNGHTFRCRKCHNLKYENFNPSSPQGRFLKHIKKILKLVEKQANMTSRIWYKSVYTERYEKFLSDCSKVGLTDIVKQARELEADIKAYKLKNKTNTVN